MTIRLDSLTWLGSLTEKIKVELDNCLEIANSSYFWGSLLLSRLDSLSRGGVKVFLLRRSYAFEHPERSAAKKLV